MSLAPMPYLPHLQSPAMLAMGLSRLNARQWIETDALLGAFHAHKRLLGRERFHDVYASCDGSADAAREAAALLEAHLLQDQGSYYQREGEAIYCRAGDFSVRDDAGPPLWRSGLLVADDLALMMPRDGVYYLAAASLCSPSHWRLADKIGRPMREVHDPVPGVHRELSGRIDRFFSHLRVESPVCRYNWSLQKGSDLFCPGHGRLVDGELYYRVERQSLRRLPESGAILFTIRVYRCPARELGAVPGALEALADAVANTPESLADYKDFHYYREALAALVGTRPPAPGHRCGEAQSLSQS